LRHTPVRIPNRLHVEVLVAFGNFEANPLASISIDEQVAVAEHAMDQVSRGSIQDDEVNALRETLFETACQCQGRAQQRRCWWFIKQDGDIDVAAGAGVSPCAAAKEVNRDHGRLGVKKRPHNLA
jgi:hypothetical protein